MRYRKNPSDWFAQLGLGFVFILMNPLLSQDASAQRMVLQIDGNQTQMYHQFMSILEQLKQRSANRIEAQIDDIDTACSLTDSQRKKLDVAAKGALESYSKKIVAQLKKTANNGMVPIQFDPGNPPDVPEEESDDDSADEKQDARVIIGGRIATMSASVDGSIEQENVWTSAVAKTLTFEQMEQLNQWQTQRQQRTRKSAVARYVANVDRKLFLSPEQMKRMTLWIDDNLGEQLTVQMDRDQQVRAVLIAGNRPEGNSKPKIEAELQGLLSTAQQEIWRAEFQASFAQLQKANDVRAGVRAIRLQPARKIPGKLPKRD